MKEYLLLLRGGAGSDVEQSPEQLQAHMQKWVQWMGGLTQQGKFVSAQPLSASGKQIRGVGKTVTDGPFMEGKEVVGGYLICKAESYDVAVDIAKGCPLLEFENGLVEVREIGEMKM